jgi:hypothetical protein
MAIIDQTFRTISCNGPGCDKKVTFNQTDKAESEKVIVDNPWLKTARFVQAAGQNFVYCSDPCEVSAVAEGVHNPQEKNIIATPSGDSQAAIREAAAQAALKAETDRALRNGESVKIQVATK